MSAARKSITTQVFTSALLLVDGARTGRTTGGFDVWICQFSGVGRARPGRSPDHRRRRPCRREQLRVPRFPEGGRRAGDGGEGPAAAGRRRRTDGQGLLVGPAV